MNFVEVLELHRAVAAFHGMNPQPLPHLGVFDALEIGEGYVLTVKASLASEETLSFLKCLAKTRKLSIREFRGFLVMYSA